MPPRENRPATWPARASDFDTVTHHPLCRGRGRGEIGACAISSLLEIEEWRREEVGVWAALRCVGRRKLVDVDETDFGYFSARVRERIASITDLHRREIV